MAASLFLKEFTEGAYKTSLGVYYKHPIRNEMFAAFCTQTVTLKLWPHRLCSVGINVRYRYLAFHGAQEKLWSNSSAAVDPLVKIAPYVPTLPDTMDRILHKSHSTRKSLQEHQSTPKPRVSNRTSKFKNWPQVRLINLAHVSDITSERSSIMNSNLLALLVVLVIWLEQERSLVTVTPRSTCMVHLSTLSPLSQ